MRTRAPARARSVVSCVSSLSELPTRGPCMFATSRHLVCLNPLRGAELMPIDPTLVTTALELPSCRIVRNLGMVRGIVVRSRSVFGTIGASLQTLVGGNITLFTQLCERAREDAFRLMLEHPAAQGANG